MCPLHSVSPKLHVSEPNGRISPVPSPLHQHHQTSIHHPPHRRSRRCRARQDERRQSSRPSLNLHRNPMCNELICPVSLIVLLQYDTVCQLLPRLLRPRIPPPNPILRSSPNALPNNLRRPVRLPSPFSSSLIPKLTPWSPSPTPPTQLPFLRISKFSSLTHLTLHFPTPSSSHPSYEEDSPIRLTYLSFAGDALKLVREVPTGVVYESNSRPVDHKVGGLDVGVGSALGQ